MRKIILFCTLLFLWSCSIFPSATTYSPVVTDVTNQEVYQKDTDHCRQVALGNPSKFNTGSIAQQTIIGASNNSAYAVINPLVPAAGALGGAASATISGYDLIGTKGIKIFLKCLEKETDRDHSALVADPGD